MTMTRNQRKKGGQRRRQIASELVVERVPGTHLKYGELQLRHRQTGQVYARDASADDRIDDPSFDTYTALYDCGEEMDVDAANIEAARRLADEYAADALTVDTEVVRMVLRTRGTMY